MPMPAAVRRPSLVLTACCLSLLLVNLDATAVNVALPAIATGFGASRSGLSWVVDAYLVVMASLLVLSGSMGDRFGRRRVFALGLVLFTAGSLACSAAPNLGWLVTFRMAQAIGGSMLNPVSLSILSNTFTDPRRRASAIGMWGAMSGVGTALGPIVGGALVDSVGWRAIFWINVPVGLVAMALTRLAVPESKAPGARRVDLAGQVLVIATLGALTSAIIEGPAAGWGSATIVGLFVAAVAAGGALVAVEWRRVQPLLELRFFRSVPLRGATVIAVAHFAATGGFGFVNTLYLQQARGYSAFAAGMATLPMAVLTVACAPISGRLVGRGRVRLPLVAAGSLLALSALGLTRLTLATPLVLLLGCYALLGAAHGLVNAPITNTAVTGMPREQAGVAAAIASTARHVGMALGVAVAGTLTATAAGPASFTRATHVCWWVVAAAGVAIAIGGVLTTTPAAVATAARAMRPAGPATLRGDVRRVA